MPDELVQDTHPQEAPTRTENAAQGDPTEISSLARYREAQKSRVSSPQTEQPKVDGTPPPTEGRETSQQPPREPYIPRERFDEVIRQRDTYHQQLQEFQQRTQQTPYGHVNQTGMVQQPPQPPKQQTPTQEQVQSFLDKIRADSTTRTEWQKKIANEGVTALVEFVEKAIDARGRPLLEEYAKAIGERISPLQRSLVQQQVNTYASRKNSDPEFAVARPYFDQLVGAAAQRGYDVTNSQVLDTIELLAKQQARQANPGFTHQTPQLAPFSERPGNTMAQTFNQSAQRALTPAEKAMAARFNMTDAQYLTSLRSMGVE